MKICEKRSKNSASNYVVIPKDVLKLCGITVGDNVIVTADIKNKEIKIKKLGE